MSLTGGTEDRDSRVEEFQGNESLESMLSILNRILLNGAAAELPESSAPSLPPVLISGVARSGSTVLHQWLCRSGVFGYPSNLISRFYQVPAVGAMVQRLLLDESVDFRNECGVELEAAFPDSYRSTLGKTRGFGNPNEFWFFWRHYLGFGDPAVLGEVGRKKADTRGFCRQLGALEQVFQKPLAMKAMIANWELPWLVALLPQAIILDLSRDPVTNMNSLLNARRQFFGSEEGWYSFRIPDRLDLDDLNPVDQVAMQVRLTRGAIDAGLAQVPEDRVVKVDFEELLSDPDTVWSSIVKALPDDLDLPDEHPDRTPFGGGGAKIRDRDLLDSAWKRSEATAES